MLLAPSILEKFYEEDDLFRNGNYQIALPKVPVLCELKFKRYYLRHN